MRVGFAIHLPKVHIQTAAVLSQTGRDGIGVDGFLFEGATHGLFRKLYIAVFRILEFSKELLKQTFQFPALVLLVVVIDRGSTQGIDAAVVAYLVEQPFAVGTGEEDMGNNLVEQFGTLFGIEAGVEVVALVLDILIGYNTVVVPLPQAVAEHVQVLQHHSSSKALPEVIRLVDGAWYEQDAGNLHPSVGVVGDDAWQVVAKETRQRCEECLRQRLVGGSQDDYLEVAHTVAGLAECVVAFTAVIHQFIHQPVAGIHVGHSLSVDMMVVPIRPQRIAGSAEKAPQLLGGGCGASKVYNPNRQHSFIPGTCWRGTWQRCRDARSARAVCRRRSLSLSCRQPPTGRSGFP